MQVVAVVQAVSGLGRRRKEKKRIQRKGKKQRDRAKEWVRMYEEALKL